MTTSFRLTVSLWKTGLCIFFFVPPTNAPLKSHYHARKIAVPRQNLMAQTKVDRLLFVVCSVYPNKIKMQLGRYAHGPF